MYEALRERGFLKIFQASDNRFPFRAQNCAVGMPIRVVRHIIPRNVPDRDDSLYAAMSKRLFAPLPVPESPIKAEIAATGPRTEDASVKAILSPGLCHNISRQRFPAQT
ncbi:MAG TPA: hypothetical protein VM659_02255 [Dongiaceae bacterium]|nr:hypothetical protein [Dongiaceae bacterium]